LEVKLVEVSLYLILGLVVGTVSGLIGIGGGVLLTPALIYLFGFTQLSAQGTTLALLVPPVSLLAAWTYYQHGDVNIKVATLIFLGFFVGGFVGAKFAIAIPDIWLKRSFGLAMLAIALKMIFAK
jgi:uncharacterized membrane protein YfcA